MPTRSMGARGVQAARLPPSARLLLVFSGVVLLACSALSAMAATGLPAASSKGSPIKHVFVLVLENEPYDITFGKNPMAPYLATTLPSRGAMLTEYYGVGHNSLDNYIAMISGQAPNPQTQDDCKIYGEFKPTGPVVAATGQLPGSGCIYPSSVQTIADQLEQSGLRWKGYMEDMGADPSREAAVCGHVAVGAEDYTRKASIKDEYAAKHDPFVYFHSIIDDQQKCARGVVNLGVLTADLQRVETTPNLAFVVPGLCHDGHDAPCVNGEPGGLVSADAFLREWVPRITASPAFRKDGLLIITMDEGADATACCDEKGLPNGPAAGKFGAGGGRTGAVLLSPFIAPNTVSAMPYNHYSLLRSIEDIFSLSHLGYAGAPGLRGFGKDVFSARFPRDRRHAGSSMRASAAH